MNFFFEIKNNLSIIEKSEVIQLLVSSFPGMPSSLNSKFTKLLNTLRDVDHILILGPGGSIVGYQLLIPKKICYQSIFYSVCGMSYMAISKEYQNGEVSLLLKKLILHRIKNFDLSIGFARKIMDNYWRPFGFVGVTNFNILTLDFKKIPSPSASNSEFKKIESKDLKVVRLIYEENFPNGWLSFLRTDQDWDLWRNNILESSFISCFILIEGKTVGYLIVNGDLVIELEIKKDFFNHAFKIVKNFCSQNNISKLRFEIPLTSPVMSELRKSSHEISCRYIYEGGHFIKASNLGALLEKSIPIYERRLHEVGIQDANFRFDSFNFYMEKGRLNIFENGNGKISNEWKLLVFMGVEGMLLNYFCSDKFLPILKIIFPVLHPQFKFLDQI